jgi:hypothetical protein
MPTIAATATISSFCITLSRFTAFVVVRNAKINSMNPMNKTNPPRAILSRCLSEKYGIASSPSVISIAQDNVFALRLLLRG